MWHKDINSMGDLLNIDSLKMFVSQFADFSHTKSHLGGKELAIFFSIFVMLQFWNLFNAKYYQTDRSLIIDIVDLFRDPKRVKESFSAGFIWISLVIVLGQILIVTFAGPVFNVSRLAFKDWVLILAVTSPILIVADVFRTIRRMASRKS
jgi:Ca2+-transporting ATPase